jgi:hypothetical protein
MATTSGSYDFSTDRDGIITRALRIVGAIGQGETAPAEAITEGAEALNDLIKEWQADGMPLWTLKEYSFTPTSGTNPYNIGVGLAAPHVNDVAPLKILQARTRDSSSNTDTPILLITRQEYNMFGAKLTEGTPTLMWYTPPGNMSGGLHTGVITLYPVPDDHAQTYHTYYFTGQKPFEDFDASTDVPDFPQYWYNAVKWGLADQLSYEYGVGLAERSMISKKAQYHKDMALSFGQEEGSLRIQPQPSWDWESY